MVEPPPMTRLKRPSGKPWRAATVAKIFWTATAVRGVMEEGFQTTTSPQTAASRAFQA